MLSLFKLQDSICQDVWVIATNDFIISSGMNCTSLWHLCQTHWEWVAFVSIWDIIPKPLERENVGVSSTNIRMHAHCTHRDTSNLWSLKCVNSVFPCWRSGTYPWLPAATHYCCFVSRAADAGCVRASTECVSTCQWGTCVIVGGYITVRLTGCDLFVCGGERERDWPLTFKTQLYLQSSLNYTQQP